MEFIRLNDLEKELSEMNYEIFEDELICTEYERMIADKQERLKQLEDEIQFESRRRALVQESKNELLEKYNR